MPDAQLWSIGFIGAGRIAGVLARALASCGYSVDVVNSRTRDSANRLAGTVDACISVESIQEVVDSSDLVFVTTPDSSIKDVVDDARWRPDHMVVHCSGALSLAPLKSAAQSGAQVASFHPFQTFIGGAIDTSLGSVTFGIESQEPLRTILDNMASRLGGTCISVPSESRALYHASAVISCGYLISVIGGAIELWKRAGLSEAEGIRAIGKIAETTIKNFSSDGLDKSMTGPVVRGDLETVRTHLNAIREHSPQLLSLYLSLCSRAIATLPARGGQVDFSEWDGLLGEYRRNDDTYVGGH
jgi:predicted short-subunit dehydrogenase-like oxidoreductase (DUF2520 family)